MSLKSIVVLSMVCSIASASSAFATPKCPDKDKSSPKCRGNFPDDFKKFIEPIGECVEESAFYEKPVKGKPGWFKKHKLRVGLSLVLDHDTNQYVVQATAAFEGIKTFDQFVLIPLASQTPSEDVTLVGKSNKIAISKSDKQSGIDPILSGKPLKGSLLYDAYARFQLLGKKEGAYFELKCALVPAALDKLARHGK